MFPDQLTKALMLPTRGHFVGIDRNNRLFTFVFALFPGLLASGTSVSLVCAFLWALISLVTKRFAFKLTGPDKIVAWCVTFYVLVTVFSVVVHPNVENGVGYILKMIPFLAIWTVIPRLRAGLPDRLLPFLITGSGIGMIGSLVFSLVQIAFFSSRAEGGAGNAAVFGLFTVLFGSISLLNAHSPSRAERALAIVGFACGMVCALLSGTRSAWLVMPFHFVILYWYLRGQSLPTITNVAKVVGTVLIVGVVAIGAMKVTERYNALETDLVHLDEQPENISSLKARLLLWTGARLAFLESPMIGYGPQNRMSIVNQTLDRPAEKQLAFSHVHNGFLNAAVDGGILGILGVLALLAAPIIAARMKVPGPGRDFATAIALLLVSGYVITGMFGIMFGHDATDAVFVYLTIVICWIDGKSAYVSIADVAGHARTDAIALHA
ncbi:O-antigen ligase family protein [Phyllobacterium lublinensis]|uniref:O-antigen ligase family protein n=1 Tax=Phyllobacterium lublinensis TaxID=2875708 RepID=UPI001CD03883|nr:O-antigen ligase family protein [Phyllobacterium sp. 2063]MBZ9654252.1 O-antigen ligase family protein [Phyllobacterium sp. 2063]